VLSFSGSLKIYLAVEPRDLRKGFDGLAADVSEKLGSQVKSGALFVFCNRRKTRLKVLYWDGSGIWILTKRLEEGHFSWPGADAANGGKLELRPEAFAMLTDGIDLRGARMRPWYER